MCLSVVRPRPSQYSYGAEVINQLAPGVLQGAGVIGDPGYIAGFYLSSLGLGSMGSAGALWEAGTTLYSGGMSNLILWQAGDFAGYTATTEMIYNIINSDIVPEGASQAAAFGALVGCFLFGDKPCPGVLNPNPY
jgi:hypothetical protein